MSTMISLGIAFSLGAFFGIVVMSLFNMSSKTERRIEEAKEKRDYVSKVNSRSENKRVASKDKTT